MLLINCCLFASLKELTWTAKSCTETSVSLLPTLAWMLGELALSSAAPGL